MANTEDKSAEVRAVAQTARSLKDIIRGDKFSSLVSSFFDNEKNRDRFLQIAVNATVSNPALANCNKASFLNCLMKLAQIGIDPDGRNAHIIPYGNVATLVIDYKGFVTLAYDSPKVSKVEAFIVYEKDICRMLNGEIIHEVRNPFEDRGAMIGAYAMCQFTDGTKKFEPMSKAQIDAIRARSRAKNSGPWVTDYEEMAKKTVFKRLQKWLPVTPRLKAAIEMDNESEFPKSQFTQNGNRSVGNSLDFGDAIDVPLSDGGEAAKEEDA